MSFPPPWANFASPPPAPPRISATDLAIFPAFLLFDASSPEYTIILIVGPVSKMPTYVVFGLSFTSLFPKLIWKNSSYLSLDVKQNFI